MAENGTADEFKVIFDDIKGGGYVAPFVGLALDSIWMTKLREEGRPIPDF